MSKNFSKLIVPNDTNFLALIGCYVSNVVRLAGFTEAESRMIELAVDEACTNVIEHAYSQDDKTTFTIETSFNDQELRFIIQDRGKRFDTMLLTKPLEVENPEKGGMGLLIIRKVMDEVKFIEKEDGTKEFHLVKYCK